ncbi:MAG: NAD(P)-binding protein [Ilumatobacteraceae bacterium]
MVGAGIGGMTAALALARTGHNVHVLERAPGRRRFVPVCRSVPIPDVS